MHPALGTTYSTFAASLPCLLAKPTNAPKHSFPNSTELAWDATAELAAITPSRMRHAGTATAAASRNRSMAATTSLSPRSSRSVSLRAARAVRAWPPPKRPNTPVRQRNATSLSSLPPCSSWWSSARASPILPRGCGCGCAGGATTAQPSGTTSQSPPDPAAAPAFSCCTVLAPAGEGVRAWGATSMLEVEGVE